MSTDTRTDGDFAGERVITEYWPTVETSRRLNRLAETLPPLPGGVVYLLGDLARVLIYCLDFGAYVSVALLNLVLTKFGAKPITYRLRSIVRYTLTNRRLRVDDGPMRTTTQFVPLDDIEEIRIGEPCGRSRTANLEVRRNGTTALVLVGVHDAVSARQTILDAVRARTEVERVLQKQAMPATPTA